MSIRMSNIIIALWERPQPRYFSSNILKIAAEAATTKPLLQNISLLFRHPGRVVAVGHEIDDFTCVVTPEQDFVPECRTACAFDPVSAPIRPISYCFLALRWVNLRRPFTDTRLETI
jgi:hypothetical protein